METISISKAQARRIILNAAGLAGKSPFGYGIEAVYKLIDHLGFVQLDANYVVERAHHQVFFARVPDYEPGWLAELCDEGKVFEYFSSDAGFIPMKDFRFTLPVKEAFGKQQNSTDKRMNSLMQDILHRVERDGPVMVGDFEYDRQSASNGWWDWRPSKVALEKLYLKGKLMISRDANFHKRYDLPLNLISPETDQRMPSAEEFARFMICRTLGALGISAVKEMAWRARRVKGNLVKAELKKMVEEGTIHLVDVEGVKGSLYILNSEELNPKISNEVFILSPFDVLNVFRHRLKDFFDFDYQIECFVPAPKRLYGYFSLPVLAGDTFIARMDAKADRKNKILLVHNIHFEELEISNKVIKRFVETLKSFILFNQCYNISFDRSNKEVYLQQIQAAFEG